MRSLLVKTSRRASNLKIPDIKHVRIITRFLGQLGISTCIQRNGWFNPTYPISQNNRQFSIGLGLKEAKDYVEDKYDYFLQEPYNPRKEIERGNIIAEIKATRRIMSILNKLDIKSADYGLKVCKVYVERLRARR